MVASAVRDQSSPAVDGEKYEGLDLLSKHFRACTETALAQHERGISSLVKRRQMNRAPLRFGLSSSNAAGALLNCPRLATNSAGGTEVDSLVAGVTQGLQEMGCARKDL